MILRLLLLATLPLTLLAPRQPHHYVFFNLSRERIADSVFLNTPAFEGAQLKYTWRELEPAKDRYDFSAIRRDLDFLRAHRKKLFIQLQEVSFDSARINVPEYLTRENEYHGGIAPTYYTSASKETRIGGWVARRWDPAVQRRFAKLLNALGKEFDGRIEGINLPETAIDRDEHPDKTPLGYSDAAYRDAVITNMKALRQAFPKSVVLQFANFMPGEWLPERDNGYLKDVYAAARALHVSVGGPDLLPYKVGQMKHSYPLIRAAADVTANGVAVQEGNYEHINPRTKARVTVAEMMEFATSYLGVTYVFWFPEEPFFSRDVIPYLGR